MKKKHDQIVPEKIEEYCTTMSTAPSKHCAAIFDYTEAHLEDSQMLIGPLEAGFLGLMIHITGVKRVLEIGCYTGYSALAMAEHLGDDGEVVTIDYDEKVAETAKDFWAKSPHGHKCQVRIGTALEILRELDGPFDMVFIDADKENYINYLEACMPMLSEKGFIIADNTLWYGKVIDPQSDDPDAEAIQAFNACVRERSDAKQTIISMRDGLSLIVPAR